MRSRSSFIIVGVGMSCTVLAACAAGSSGGAPTLATGTYSAESGGATLSARTGDCGMYPSFNVDANNEAQAASRLGVHGQPSPVKALRDALQHGSPLDPRSLVGLGYPAAGWAQKSASPSTATFQAPLDAGTAELTFTRADGQWWLSHGQKNC